VKNEAIICFDIDETLLMPEKGDGTDVFVKYNGRVEKRNPHRKHIQFLKDNYFRGFTIYLWSGNGAEWCAAASDALGLDEYVDHVMAKPIKIVDDLDPSEWLPKRIYLENK
jgi:FMN phosphatase YigB (HAD superfamily)